MKIKKLLYKLRHIVALGAIAAVAVATLWWINEDTVQSSVGQWHRNIINDSYSVLTQPITNDDGVYQPITVKADTNFYGVNLMVHTYGRVGSGTMYVDLLDINGNVVASAAESLSTVYNDNFKTFIFGEKNMRNRKHQDYVLHIYVDGATAEDRVALWKSDKEVRYFDDYYRGVGIEDFGTLVENGDETRGTIALQYIDQYATSSMYPYFRLIGAAVFATLMLGYVIVFIFKAKIHNIFLFFALAIGFIFSIFTPLKGAPDEYTHMGMSYYNSNLMMGIEDSYYDGKLMVRDTDYGDILYHPSYTAYEMTEMYEGLLTDNTSGDRTAWVWARWSEGYFPPLYWAQATGVTLARLLDVGRVPLFVMGRLANLVMYTALVYIAIRIMPFFKATIAAVALMPIPLQLAASFNYDPLVIGLCFVFTAKVFSLAYKKEKVKWLDILVLVALAACIAPSKAVYIVVVSLVFIIPWNKFCCKKQVFITYGAVMAVAVIMWLAFNQNFVSTIKESIMPTAKTVETVSEEQSAEIVITEEVVVEVVSQPAASQTVEETAEVAAPAPKDDLLDNGDSKYLFTPGYILSYPQDTIKLIFNTMQENAVLYIYQIFGGILGEVILSPVHVNWLYVLVVMSVVFMTTLKPADQQLQHKGARKWWALAVALGVAALLCVACISWTPVNYDLVFGIQGRYFIPVLPLILLFFTNENVTIKKNIDGLLMYILAVADLLIILDAFTIMAENGVMLR